MKHTVPALQELPVQPFFWSDSGQTRDPLYDVLPHEVEEYKISQTCKGWPWSCVKMPLFGKSLQEECIHPQSRLTYIMLWVTLRLCLEISSVSSQELPTMLSHFLPHAPHFNYLCSSVVFRVFNTQRGFLTLLSLYDNIIS